MPLPEAVWANAAYHGRERLAVYETDRLAFRKLPSLVSEPPGADNEDLVCGCGRQYAIHLSDYGNADFLFSPVLTLDQIAVAISSEVNVHAAVRARVRILGHLVALSSECFGDEFLELPPRKMSNRLNIPLPVQQPFLASTVEKCGTCIFQRSWTLIPAEADHLFRRSRSSVGA